MTKAKKGGCGPRGCMAGFCAFVGLFVAAAFWLYWAVPESRRPRDLRTFSTLEISEFSYVTHDELRASRKRSPTPNALPEIRNVSLNERFNDNIRLNGIRELQAVTAQGLVDFFPGITLTLGGLNGLSDEVAGILAKRKGSLYLDHVSSVSESVARLLSQHPGDVLSLRGLSSVDEPQLRELRKHRGRILLPAEASRKEH